MAVGSIIVAALSLLCIGLAVLFTPVPVVGAVFAFGAPALAIAGLIMGGTSISRARRAGQGSDLALAGVIFSALCLVPALLTALTCGVCNALCSTGRIETHRDFRFGVQRGSGLPADSDAGPPHAPAPPPFPPPAAPGEPESDPADEPAQAPGDSDRAPPPAFPPPPISE